MKKGMIAALVVVLGCASTLLIVRSMAKDTILETHTKFLFGQIESELPDSVKAILLSGRTAANWSEFSSQQYGILADALCEIKVLDWNSCSLSGNMILDGWNRKCIVESRTTPTPAIRLSSCGRDGVRVTDDDIVREVEIRSETNAAQPASGDL